MDKYSIKIGTQSKPKDTKLKIESYKYSIQIKTQSKTKINFEQKRRLLTHVIK